ncbi:hypothetical protein [Actinoplanes sp. G11-F43]|uniref:hypothetical protein n=1 Tax=Actinoplanes sp. G11-F43 TaxID=3424130 RepID=UPI003D35962B
MTTPNPQTPGPRRRTGRSLIFPVIAVLAFLLGAFAAVQSWRAAENTAEVLDRLAAPATVPPSVTPPEPAPVSEAAEQQAEPSTEPPTEPAGDNTTGSAPVLDARTQYTDRYDSEDLRVPVDCNSAIYVDLDEPRMKVESSLAEFYYQNPCGTSTAFINLSDGVEGSVVTSTAVTPVECAENIRRSPMSSDRYPIRRGQVYCIKTSLDTARSSAVTWKMVLVEVTATGQDGTVTFRASAWDIPA